MNTHQLISKFVAQLCEKQYAFANSTLANIVEAKMSERIKKEAKKLDKGKKSDKKSGKNNFLDKIKGKKSAKGADKKDK